MIQSVVLVLALVWDASVIPSESCEVYSLFNICLQSHSMPGACRSTEVIDARVLCLTIIVKLHELGRRPILDIDIYVGLRKEIDVSINVSEKDPVIFILMACFYLRSFVPKLALVAICSFIELNAPWISVLTSLLPVESLTVPMTVYA